MSETTDAPETPTPSATPGQEPQQAQQSSNELPDWAREKISKANNEAANYRVQLRESESARTALETKVADLTAQGTAASSALNERQGDFDRLVTAVQTLFPEKPEIFAFAKTLQGDSEEELKSHAVELKQMFGISTGPSPATDRSQGHGSPSNSDPASEFAALLNQNLSR